MSHHYRPPTTIRELESEIDALLAHEPPTLADVVQTVRLARAARNMGHVMGADFLEKYAAATVATVKGLSYVAVRAGCALND